MSSYTIPSVLESTPKGERVSDVFSRLLSERIVFIGTPIDDGVANVVIAQILHLAAASPTDIHLYVNSPGGSFPAMMAIYDTMQFVGPDVATLCVGQAASTSAILVAAGAPGKRSLLPHARVVLHQPHLPGSQGSLSDLALEAAEAARIRAIAEGLLAAHTGRTAEQIRADTDRALVLNGDDAVSYGVVDQVVERATLPGEEHRTTALRPGS
ncbi:MAG: ATP-dependent Clp protease proteolytic subunit [Actinomycetota bacterium]